MDFDRFGEKATRNPRGTAQAVVSGYPAPTGQGIFPRRPRDMVHAIGDRRGNDDARGRRTHQTYEGTMDQIVIEKADSQAIISHIMSLPKGVVVTLDSIVQAIGDYPVDIQQATMTMQYAGYLEVGPDAGIWVRK